MTREQITRVQRQLGLPDAWAESVLSKRRPSRVEIDSESFAFTLRGSVEIFHVDDGCIKITGDGVALSIFSQMLIVETLI